MHLYVRLLQFSGRLITNEKWYLAFMLCVKLKKPTLDLSKAKVLKHITNSKLENIAV